MSNENHSEAQTRHGNGSSGALSIKLEPDAPDQEHGGDQTNRLNALFQWAEHVLETAGLLKALRDAKTREELEAIKFERGHPALIIMIREALHPCGSKTRATHFQHLTEKMLENILSNRFTAYQKEQKKALFANEQQTTAEEEAREKREEDVKLYGACGQYKVRDRGVFVRTTAESDARRTGFRGKADSIPMSADSR